MRTVCMGICMCVVAWITGVPAHAGQPAATEPQGTAFHATPTARVPRFKAPPKLDGVLDDAAWATAARLTPFRHFRTGAAAKQLTTVLAGFDDANLYVAFECREPQATRLTRRHIGHDAMALFAADHVELFLKAEPLADAYYQFAVEAFGATYESKWEDRKWHAPWQSATRVGKQGWTVELAIPFGSIAPGAKLPPRFVRANFCRTRRLDPGESSAWSPTFGLFHNPARFGGLALGPGSDVQLDKAVVREQSRGVYTVSAAIGSTAKAPRPLAATLHRKVGNKLAPVASQRVDVAPGGSASATFRIECADAYHGPLLLTLADAASGDVVWFAGPQAFALQGANGLKLARALGPEVSPALKWLETRRLRACCYGFGLSPLPALPLRPATKGQAATPSSELALQGEAIVRVHVPKGGMLKFTLTGGRAGSLFTQSTYAAFDADGTHLGDGIVEAGKSVDAALPVPRGGLCMVWLNTGPASSNACRLRVGNRSWVLDGRGRSRYLGTRVSVNSLRDLSLAGFNTVLLAAWMWGDKFATDEGLRSWTDKVSQWAEAAQRYNMRIIPYVGWACASTEVTAAGDYRKNVSTRQIDGPRPCPLSEKYWERTFQRRGLAVARLAKRYPSIMGFGLDPESYYFGHWYRDEAKRRGIKSTGWGSVVFFSADECFCDHCFGGFLRARGLKPPTIAADGSARLKWLEGQGLKDAYYKRLEDQLAALTAGMRNKLHAANPDLALAVMLLGVSDTWWCRGASRGLGSPRMPVLEYDERTYTPGYTPAVPRHKARFRRWGAHVLHAGTLWAGKHPPQKPHYLSAQMYHFAVRDGGYWFWPGNSSLWRNPDTLRQYYSLAGRQEDYWRAFMLANREIDRKLAQGDRYASVLDRLEPPPPAPNLDRVKTRNAWGKLPYYPLRVRAGTSLAFHVPKAASRFVLHYGLNQGRGDWSLVFACGDHSVAVRKHLDGPKGETATIDVPPACRGKAWTVRVEAKGDGAEQYLGIRLGGKTPFLSVTPATLLVPVADGGH